VIWCAAAPTPAWRGNGAEGQIVGRQATSGSMAVGSDRDGGSVQGVLDGIPIVLVLLAGVAAPLAGWYATRRARDPAVWFVLGVVLGPLAIALLALAPPGRCPNCDLRIEGWASICDQCGVSLATGAAGVSRPAAPPRPVERDPVRWPDPTDRPFAPRAPAATAPTPIGTARTAMRREAQGSWPSQTMVSPMALGTRASFTASNFEAATTGDDITAGEVLSTGVYISGNAGLEIGATYAIARDGDRLRVFGPVDTGQLKVRHEGPLLDFDVTAMDDRVIISGREGRSSLAIVFRTVGGMRAADLELALAAPVAGAGP
jgi:hypothetical protein